MTLDNSLPEKSESVSGMATTMILVAISHDQTFARFLVSEGELSLQAAWRHYSGDVLEQCIGCRELRPETGEIRLLSGDMMLLVSDGIYRSMAPQVMKDIVAGAGSCTEASDRLIDQSLLVGGKDNLTALVAKIR